MAAEECQTARSCMAARIRRWTHPHSARSRPRSVCGWLSLPWRLSRGLASAPAIEARWGAPGEKLPAGHAAWERGSALPGAWLVQLDLHSLHLSALFWAAVVMRSEGLLPLVGVKLGALLGGYNRGARDRSAEIGNTGGGVGGDRFSATVMSLLRSSAPRAHAVAIVKDALNSVWKMARNWKIQVVALYANARTTC